MNNEQTVVYWSIVAIPERMTSMNLLWEPPKPLIKILPEGGIDNPGNYRVCTAANQYWKNVYALIHPQESYVKVSGNFNKPNLELGQDYWRSENSPLKNRYRVDYDFSWVFFCEESVVLEQLPAFMHQTEDSKTSVMPVAAYDIGKWFRAINLSYMLFEEKNYISIKKGDPATYLKFNTNKKIILKQFEMTEDIRHIANQVAGHKNYISNESLNSLYNRFIRSNRHKVVLKKIKENLLDI